jgi:hypothetical protein
VAVGKLDLFDVCSAFVSQLAIGPAQVVRPEFDAEPLRIIHNDSVNATVRTITSFSILELNKRCCESHFLIVCIAKHVLCGWPQQLSSLLAFVSESCDSPKLLRSLASAFEIKSWYRK